MGNRNVCTGNRDAWARGGIEGEVGVIEGEWSDVIEREGSDVIEVKKRLEGRVRESTKTEYTRRSREVYGR